MLVHAVPDDDRPFRALAALVQADLRQVHLSVARVLREADVDDVVRRLHSLLPITATARTLELTAQRDGVWPPGQRFSLGG